MSRASRVDEVIESLLSVIESGRYAPGSRLPAEEELAVETGASRLTVREAVRVLAAQRVLDVRQGRGTFVNPVDKWTSIEALMRVQQANPLEVLVQLFQVRGFIEIGAAELFATRVTDEQLDVLRGQLADMQTAHAEVDVARMVAADLAFHQTILDGCGNPFIAATMLPLARPLVEARRETSKLPQMREHAIEEHGKILAALVERDRVAARKAMRSHMRQTQDDTRVFFDRSGE